MSKSLYISILLPMDQYNSTDVYEEDGRLREIYGDTFVEGKYCKKLKIRSVYASTNDIKAYVKGKYDLTDDEMKNCAISCNGQAYYFRFPKHEEIQLLKREYSALKKEHIDEGLYCLEYKSFSPEIYGSVQDELFTYERMIIDEQLIEKAIELLEKECMYAEDEESGTGREDNRDARDVVIDKIIDHEEDMDGRLIASLIIGREVSKRVGGIAIAEYE